MKMNVRTGIALFCIYLAYGMITACQEAGASNGTMEMVSLLSDIRQTESVYENPFYPEAGVAYYDSVEHSPTSNVQQSALAAFSRARCLLQLGKEKESVAVLEGLLARINHPAFRLAILKNLAIAYLRIGERSNCVMNHGAASCVFPIKSDGVHANKTGSEKAIELYQRVLDIDTGDLESRWLLNIAYMTLGEYPGSVPANRLIPGLDADTSFKMEPFQEMAVNTGLDINNMAGGSIVDDFDNDGILDIVTSGWELQEGMHYCKNNGNGTFTNLSAASGLKSLTGGLNIMQTDYNNDGLKDIFVLRGAWKDMYGREPVSLLRNDGNGKFTDVTRESRLLSLHPTQTATWADFNNDGWLDVFVGTESSINNVFPTELYINNKNGTFTEVAASAGCAIRDFVKGVNSGDFNNDGLPDIVVSSLNGIKRLLRNDGVHDGAVHFTDVGEEAGIKANHDPSFSTWFFDYNNDGWQDIVMCNYDFKTSLAVYAAAEALHKPIGRSGQIMLFRNNHDCTFTDVSEQTGVNKVAFAMGANFGDIDNDGYPDMYFGTGNPMYQSLVPNKMFKNINGERFVDVTTVARVGNLQKGHGVAFGDLDNDGDLDIYIDMGGAYPGDAYQNLLYVNPGQNLNHWLSVDLEGVTSNRAAIGAKIRCSFKDNGSQRTVFTTVNSGGSFGANPLRQHLGLGNCKMIDSLEIKWPVTGQVQVLRNIPADQFIKIREDEHNYSKIPLNRFAMSKAPLPGCAPSSTF